MEFETIKVDPKEYERNKYIMDEFRGFEYLNDMDRKKQILRSYNGIFAEAVFKREIGWTKELDFNVGFGDGGIDLVIDNKAYDIKTRCNHEIPTSVILYPRDIKNIRSDYFLFLNFDVRNMTISVLGIIPTKDLSNFVVTNDEVGEIKYLSCRTDCLQKSGFLMTYLKEVIRQYNCFEGKDKFDDEFERTYQMCKEAEDKIRNKIWSNYKQVWSTEYGCYIWEDQTLKRKIQEFLDSKESTNDVFTKRQDNYKELRDVARDICVILKLDPVSYNCQCFANKYAERLLNNQITIDELEDIATNDNLKRNVDCYGKHDKLHHDYNNPKPKEEIIDISTVLQKLDEIYDMQKGIYKYIRKDLAKEIAKGKCTIENAGNKYDLTRK